VSAIAPGAYLIINKYLLNENAHNRHIYFKIELGSYYTYNFIHHFTQRLKRGRDGEEENDRASTIS
jgi:hypothetical protein